MTEAVRVRELTKRFGDFTAVDGISFDVRPGEILGFLGPNGAGKTTTIRMILGLLSPTSGEVLVKGLDIRRELKAVKRLTGYMSQQFSLYPLLTALQNVEFFGGISGLGRKALKAKKAELAEALPSGAAGRMVRDIPPGIRQKIALFCSLLADPELLFLDEPTSGVDPEARREFWMEIYELKQRGKTVLVTTHNLDEAEFADRILIIDRGRIVVQGAPRDLLRERRAASVEDLFKEAVGSHAQD
jgi:ABC-2 type transport system ATP-binding protein